MKNNQPSRSRRRSYLFRAQEPASRREPLRGKKIIASFELMIIIVSSFAFAHGLYLIDDGTISEDYVIQETKLKTVLKFGIIINTIFKRINEPMIPLVSASSNEVSSSIGCCFVSSDGQKCGTASKGNCASGSSFVEGALCSQVSFCKKGCCFSEETGIYDNNVLESDCLNSWVDDSNCNMPGAERGCCVLGSSGLMTTYGQCEVRTIEFAQGQNSIVNWSGGLDEMECSILSASQNEGACVLSGGDCKFNTEEQCYGLDGEFNKGYLCSSPSLNTSCEMTTQTTCVDGMDEVYFIDSCGNKANIYDLSRVDDVTYWDKIIEKENSCGSDTEDGNANSENCGNCNRFAGGICASATENNLTVDDVGSFYCKATSCMVDEKEYKNGESWCAYDGKIGNGDDVVGSRHWRYVCSQGEVQIEPCADYRNEICIQSDTFGAEGEEVEFKNSNCVANNWRECVGLNSEGEEGIEKCADALNCMIERVQISDGFDFNVCLPKYPGGFNLKDERYGLTATGLCASATQKCTYTQKSKFWGGCKDVANRECLEEGFAQKMNEFCRKIGDCGGEVNILGKYTENYAIKNSPKLSDIWIEGLIALAEPVEGQSAEVEDYSKYLEAAGILKSGGESGDNSNLIKGLVGVGGLGMAVQYAAEQGLIGVTSGILSPPPGLGLGGVESSSIAGFASVAIGAAAGAIVGAILAKSLGLSQGGTMLMVIGGALVGGAIAYALFNAAFVLLTSPFFLVGVALIVLSLFFGGSKCEPIEVEFECKPWQPPRGGEDCEECNNDPLKPCSEYRCSSLGATCEIINKGTLQEMCINGGASDTAPPILSPQFGAFSGGLYDDVSDSGFSITSLDGGCLNPYETIVFGITTDEPAQCRFDIEPNNFNDMQFDLGGNLYLYNHTAVYALPDPSYGQSKGSDWTGDLSFYVKCVDRNGFENPNLYTVNMCIKEGKDVTPPIIKSVYPIVNTIIGFNVTSKNMTVITNELAMCKWDLIDKTYSSMENSMNCNDTLENPSNPLGYVCKDIVPTPNTDNIYYIRCMDQPWLNESADRTANTQSFVYTLRKPEIKIKIDLIEPNQDIEVNTDMATIELKIQTSGGGERHYCSWSFSGYDNMIEMFETGEGKTHSQMLNRPVGDNKIYIECSDETGDSVQGLTEFKIIKDTSTPQIARVWQTNNKLYIVTTEIAECRYSTETCRFNWADAEMAGTGSEHIISAVRGKTYYVKCEDNFGNLPAGCSIKAKIL